MCRSSLTRISSAQRAHKQAESALSPQLAALKSEAKIIELKRIRSTFYVHREAVLEQLRLMDDPEVGPPMAPRIRSSRHAAVTIKDVRSVYERLKSEQGGISTVKIYDIMTRLGASAVLTKPLAEIEILPATIRAILG